MSQISPDSLRIQGPLKRSSSGRLYPVSSVREHNRKDGKYKISWVLKLRLSSPQASPKVEASDRPKQAQCLPTCRIFKMETPECIRASLIPGDWVSSIDLSDAYLHIPIHQNPRKYLRFPVHLPPFFWFDELWPTFE